MVLQCCLSTVCDDLLVAFEQAWAGVVIFERGLSRVCGEIFIAFGDVWSEMGGSRSAGDGQRPSGELKKKNVCCVFECFKEAICGQCHVVGSVWEVSKRQLVEIVTFLARFLEVLKRQMMVLCRMSRIPRHGGWGIA